MIKTRGIYVTKPEEWVDNAGGTAIKGFSHRGFWFLPDGRVIPGVVKNRELNIIDFVMFDNSINYYKQENAETVIMEFYRGSKYNFKVPYKLRTSDVLINDKGREYYFEPVDEAELQAATEELNRKTSESDD